MSRGAGTRKQLVVLLATTGAGLALVAAGPTGSAGAAPTTCQGQPVTIVATAGSSTVQGTEGPDVIDGAGRSSLTILGLGGDDVICSGAGTSVTIDGGDGDDELLFVGDGDGEGRGGEGDDRLVDATTYDLNSVTMIPGPGDDTVVGHDRVTRLVFGGTAGVRILAADGIADGEGHDTFTGIRRFVGTGASDTFVGSESDDSFRGGPETDGSTPSGAPDVAFGGGGSDFLELVGRAEGGEGSDGLRVHGPNASASGGPGSDRLLLFPGFACTSACRVSADGGAGVDRVTLNPEYGGVRVNLSSGRASMGASGRASLVNVEDVVGTWYRDVIIGNARRNRLYGEGGRDVLRGRAGADKLYGANGRDVLVGGGGRDRAVGGLDRDRCQAEVRRSC
nr:calcium-binding protein [Nocardioides lijunqiniae]